MEYQKNTKTTVEIARLVQQLTGNNQKCILEIIETLLTSQNSYVKNEKIGNKEHHKNEENNGY